jgi:hypothetical protein
MNPGRTGPMRNDQHLKRLTTWLLRVLLLLLAGVAAYLWSGFSPRVLICFDRTGLEPGEPGFGLPIDYTGTLLRCLGPIGWLAALGVFALAFTMASAVHGWRWPLRGIVAVAPVTLVAVQIVCVSDLHPWVRPVCLQIVAAQMALAVLVAVLCRPIAGLLLKHIRAAA